MLKILCPFILTLMFFSCKEEPGEGGSSSIKGKVYVKDYNSSFTVLNAEYYGHDEDVFIVYGDGTTYSDDYSTSYDGSYEFRYLRKGTYKVFVYSDDSTQTSESGEIPVIKTVEITSKNQVVEVPDIVIFK